MKKHLKIVSLVLSIALVASLFCGCSAASKKDQGDASAKAVTESPAEEAKSSAEEKTAEKEESLELTAEEVLKQTGEAFEKAGSRRESTTCDLDFGVKAEGVTVDMRLVIDAETDTDAEKRTHTTMTGQMDIATVNSKMSAEEYSVVEGKERKTYSKMDMNTSGSMLGIEIPEEYEEGTWTVTSAPVEEEGSFLDSYDGGKDLEVETVTGIEIDDTVVNKNTKYYKVTARIDGDTVFGDAAGTLGLGSLDFEVPYIAYIDCETMLPYMTYADATALMLAALEKNEATSEMASVKSFVISSVYSDYGKVKDIEIPEEVIESARLEKDVESALSGIEEEELADEDVELPSWLEVVDYRVVNDYDDYAYVLINGKKARTGMTLKELLEATDSEVKSYDKKTLGYKDTSYVTLESDNEFVNITLKIANNGKEDTNYKDCDVYGIEIASYDASGHGYEVAEGLKLGDPCQKFVEKIGPASEAYAGAYGGLINWYGDRDFDKQLSIGTDEDWNIDSYELINWKFYII